MATVCPLIDRASKSAHAFLRQYSHHDFENNNINPQFTANFETTRKQKISFASQSPFLSGVPFFSTPHSTPHPPGSPRPATVTLGNHARGETINIIIYIYTLYYKKDLSPEIEVRGGLAPGQKKKTVSGRASIFGPAGERIHDGLMCAIRLHTPPWWRDDDVQCIF